ncbi:MAG TPA: zinc ribbon domain-containing protein [Candidatus Goldiibacteriota bacterium]|nr:zinc ribbon domain-containing protein [Candidatus Goldiibacteriota bacterium]
MPTYVYKCKNCGEFEIHQPITADTFTICPKCGGKEIMKVLSASVGFVLKGSGFYQNDYKNKPEPKPECGGCDHAGGCPHSKNN